MKERDEGKKKRISDYITLGNTRQDRQAEKIFFKRSEQKTVKI